MRKAALHNLGCKVNAYETEAMQQLLEQNGYEIVPFSEKADVYVINTCSVTNMADRKSRQMLHRARKLNPKSVVVAAGCYVQTAEEQVRKDCAVDILIGNNKKHELIKRLEDFYRRKEGELKAAEKEEEIIEIGQDTEYEEMLVSKTAEHTRAFIKVQDGCNQFCSYCIIPYARGRVRSRGLKEVLAEVERLAENGYQEVVLTGIHLSSYGMDIDSSLLHLIQKVHEIEGIRRIRLGSLEPKIVTEEFAEELSKLEKLCPHFHLSLQSGCDTVLKRMNRKYTCKEYRQGCEYLRKFFIHPAITTDVIVGFPGETEEEFEMTRKFLEEIAFFEVHIFKFSPRKGTLAAGMEGQVPEEIKTKRSALLIKDTEKMSLNFTEWYQNRKVTALMEETIEEEGVSYQVGHTPEYVKVAVKGREELTNQMVSGRVSGSLSNHILLLTEDLTENID